MSREFVLSIEIWKIQRTRQNILEASQLTSVEFIRDRRSLYVVFKNCLEIHTMRDLTEKHHFLAPVSVTPVIS